MSDKRVSGVPFDGTSDVEQELWDGLAELSGEEPSDRLRQSFYRELGRAGRPPWHVRLRDRLGFESNMGWLTAVACLLAGVGAGQLVAPSMDSAANRDPGRLAALEQNLAMLNRELILDRLQDASAGQRLRGVVDAIALVEDDAEIARALVVRATEDQVHSVRSAAIDALGSQLKSTTVGPELMSMLENVESPLVQLALVDLVLRNGSEDQLRKLHHLANKGRLYPDINRYVEHALEGSTV